MFLLTVSTARKAGFASAATAMANVQFNNMLECKISMKTYKMYFVIKVILLPHALTVRARITSTAHTSGPPCPLRGSCPR